MDRANERCKRKRAIVLSFSISSLFLMFVFSAGVGAQTYPNPNNEYAYIESIQLSELYQYCDFNECMGYWHETLKDKIFPIEVACEASCKFCAGISDLPFIEDADNDLFIGLFGEHAGLAKQLFYSTSQDILDSVKFYQVNKIAGISDNHMTDATGILYMVGKDFFLQDHSLPDIIDPIEKILLNYKINKQACGMCAMCAGDFIAVGATACAVNPCFFYPCNYNCEASNVIHDWSYYCKTDNELWKKRFIARFECNSDIPRTGGCEMSEASEWVDDQKVRDCPNGCEKDRCVGEGACDTNDDCPKGYFVGNSFCIGDDVYRNHIGFTCMENQYGYKECMKFEGNVIYEGCDSEFPCENGYCKIYEESVAEILNDGIDNDLDGMVDEGKDCNDSEQTVCGSDVGLCQKGIQTCSNGHWGSCAGGVAPHAESGCDGEDNDCDGFIDENGCGSSGECYDGEYSDFDQSVGNFEYFKYGPYCANGKVWHEADIDDDGYPEKYMLKGEEYKVWANCKMNTHQDIIADPAVYAFGNWLCEPDGGCSSNGCAFHGCYDPVGGQVNHVFCNSAHEKLLLDLTFVDVMHEIRYPEMYCYTVLGLCDFKRSDGFESDILKTCFDAGMNEVSCSGPGVVHTEPYMAIRCGVDADCSANQYCYKPTLSVPTTYMCLDKCGDGVCEPGEICPDDSHGDESCDGMDNDCDGVVDEGLIMSCGLSGKGACEFGTKTCVDGAWGECIGAIGPTEEVCDGLDNNCDGTVDESNVCGDYPTIDMMNPDDGLIVTDGTVELTCSATDDTGISQILLIGTHGGMVNVYTENDGYESIGSTFYVMKNTSGTSATATFGLNCLPRDTTLTWSCAAIDIDGHLSYVDGSRTVIVDDNTNWEVGGCMEWWNFDWEYKKQAEVIETGGLNTPDYPVIMDGFDCEGYCNPDGSDIVVVDESADAVMDFAVSDTGDDLFDIVFRTDLVAGQVSEDIYIYYGNPAATYLGDAWEDVRYEVHDEFDDSHLDPYIWSKGSRGGSYLIEDGILKLLTGTGDFDMYFWIKGWEQFDLDGYNLRMETRLKHIFNSDYANGQIYGLGQGYDTLAGMLLFRFLSTLPGCLNQNIDGQDRFKFAIKDIPGCYDLDVITAAFTDYQTHVFSVTHDSATLEMLEDGDSIELNSNHGLVDLSPYFYVSNVDQGSRKETWIDYVKLYKYLDNEPFSQMGMELKVPVVIPDDDGDGYKANTDCDDTNPDVNPGAIETCNGIDDNCDGQIDNPVELDYWIEEKVDGSYAKVWVEVPDIAANSFGTAYLYYGNSELGSRSNGEDVFLDFDDFEYTDRPRDHGWTEYLSGTTTIETSTEHPKTGDRGLRIYCDGGSNHWGAMQKISPDYGNSIAEAWFYEDMDDDGTVPLNVMMYHKHGGSHMFMGVHNGHSVMNYIDYNQTWTALDVERVDEKWRKFGIAYDGTAYRIYVDNVLKNEYLSDESPSEVGIGNFWTGTGTWHWDAFRIRKYSEPEPTTGLGAERVSYINDYQYVREITIDNSANPESLTGYAILVNVPYSPGMQTDFDDIGFFIIDDTLLPDSLNSKQDGICSGSLQVCMHSQGWVDDYSGITGYEDVEISCDGIDNDCDGTVDGMTRQCGISDIGICTYGSESCSVGIWGNCDAVLPGNEIECNSIDEDCDGSDLCVIDDDNDGYGLAVDCDDNNPDINPGATEICNDGIDQDCTGADHVVTNYQGNTCSLGCLCISGMGDFDGTIGCAPGLQYCNDVSEFYCTPYPGSAVCQWGSSYAYDICDTDCPVDSDSDGHCDDSYTGTGGAECHDCDDSNANIYPGATELCNNGIDDNCDGQVDENCQNMIDDDLDGYGLGVDCDDNDPNINPGAIEICNDGIDQDCSGADHVVTNYQSNTCSLGCLCTAGMGDFDTTGCAPGLQHCNDVSEFYCTPYPGTSTTCSWGTSIWFDFCDTECPVDLDGDGHCNSAYSGTGADCGDCDDGDVNVNPGVDEMCGNSIDDNCDGQVDEDCGGAVDNDGDGYNSSVDCDDNDPNVYPNATEICNDGVDQDCNGKDHVVTNYQGNTCSLGCLCTAGMGDLDRNSECAPGLTACHDKSEFYCSPSPGSGNCQWGDGTAYDFCDTNCPVDLDNDGHCDSSYTGTGGAECNDCDDGNWHIKPDTIEACDGIDNDCNGLVDDNCQTCIDGDGDGFYLNTVDCLSGNDCNDNDPDVRPPMGEEYVISDLTLCPGEYDILGGIRIGYNTRLDCNGATLRGNNYQNYGIYSFTTKATIENCAISDYYRGIYLRFSHDSVVNNNDISNNKYGIYLYYTNTTNITDNILTDNSYYAIYMYGSRSNNVWRNDLYTSRIYESSCYDNDFCTDGANQYYDGATGPICT